MRVVAGEYGGRKLRAVPGLKTRPTTDKIKEAVFNIIGPYFSGGRSLDLFAGSGGLSIEAVSRGIDHAVLIDRFGAAIKTIQQNIEVTKQPEKFTVYKRDAEKMMRLLSEDGEKFDLVFFDPPYQTQKIETEIEQLQALALLNQNCVIVCETNQAARFPEMIGDCRLTEQKSYGTTLISIFRAEG